MKSENGKVMSWHSPGEKEEKKLVKYKPVAFTLSAGGSDINGRLYTIHWVPQKPVNDQKRDKETLPFFDSVSLLVYMTCHENAVSLESRGRLCFCGGARTNSPTPFFIETLILLSGKYPYMTLKTVSFSILYASNKRYWLDCEVLQNSIEWIFFWLARIGQTIEETKQFLFENSKEQKLMFSFCSFGC